MAVAARGAGDEIETGGADEAGLHAVGTGIAVDQLVVAADDRRAELDRGNAEQIGLLGKIEEDGAGENGEVARGGHLRRVRQAVGVGVMGAGHAEFGGGGVHLVDEAGQGATHALGEDHGHVIGRLHQHHLQGVVDRDLSADLEAHLGRLLRRRILRHGDQRFRRQPARPQRLEGDIGRHQLGDGGGIPRLGCVFGQQHLAAFHIDHQRGRRLRRHRGQQQRRKQQEGQQWGRAAPGTVAKAGAEQGKVQHASNIRFTMRATARTAGPASLKKAFAPFQ